MDIIELFEQKAKESPDSILGWFLMGSYSKYRLGKDLMPQSELDYLSNLLKDNWDKVSTFYKKDITIDYNTEPVSFDIKYTESVKMFTINFGPSIKSMLDKVRNGFGEGETRLENTAEFKDNAKEILRFLKILVDIQSKRS